VVVSRYVITVLFIRGESYFGAEFKITIPIKEEELDLVS
jgi:hypothetical protein